MKRQSLRCHQVSTSPRICSRPTTWPGLNKEEEWRLVRHHPLALQLGGLRPQGAGLQERWWEMVLKGYHGYVPKEMFQFQLHVLVHKDHSFTESQNILAWKAPTRIIKAQLLALPKLLQVGSFCIFSSLSPFFF